MYGGAGESKGAEESKQDNVAWCRDEISRKGLQCFSASAALKVELRSEIVELCAHVVHLEHTPEAKEQLALAKEQLALAKEQLALAEKQLAQARAAAAQAVLDEDPNNAAAQAQLAAAQTQLAAAQAQLAAAQAQLLVMLETQREQAAQAAAREKFAAMSAQAAAQRLHSGKRTHPGGTDESSSCYVQLGRRFSQMTGIEPVDYRRIVGESNAAIVTDLMGKWRSVFGDKQFAKEEVVQQWCGDHLCTGWRDGSRTLHDTHAGPTVAVCGRSCEPDLILTRSDIGLVANGAAALLEVKPFGTNLTERAVGQVAWAARAALRLCSLRSRILCLLTNLQQARLYVFELDANQDVALVEWAQTANEASTLGLIVALLHASDAQLDMPMSFVKEWPVVGLLGRGHTSSVFAISRSQGAAFAKVFFHQDRCDSEFEVLCALPEGTTPFSSVERVSFQTVSEVERWAIVAEPVLEEVAELRVEDWYSLLEWLHALHTAGYVHRDVRPNNFMMRDRDGHLCLIDYGYAVPARSEPFGGTVTFASENVLQLLSAGGGESLTMTSNDDLESVVKCWWRLRFASDWDRAVETAGACPSDTLARHAEWATVVWTSFVERVKQYESTRLYDSLRAAREGRAADIMPILQHRQLPSSRVLPTRCMLQ